MVHKCLGTNLPDDPEYTPPWETSEDSNDDDDSDDDHDDTYDTPDQPECTTNPNHNTNNTT
eukprot:13397405-Heterocapsa_arctica.AAC.1